MTPCKALDSLRQMFSEIDKYVSDLESKASAAEARAQLAEERLEDLEDFALAIPYLTQRYGPIVLGDFDLRQKPPQIVISRNPATREYTIRVMEK